MSIFDWLLGRKAHHAPPDPLPYERKLEALTPPALPETKPPITITTAEPNEIWIDYATQDSPVRRRRVIPLCASPGPYLTAIDLDLRRVRTYRRDKIVLAGRARTEDSLDIRDLPATGAFDPKDFESNYYGLNPDPHEMAAILRKGMICPLSILKLIAVTDGDMSNADTDLIIDYARREARFAVNDGWVPIGEKKNAWPILADMLRSLQPRREHLDCYVLTANEDWRSPRRFAALNQAMENLGAAQGKPSAALVGIANEVNGLRTNQ